MKVVKFGGSSLASATQLQKVLNIVKSDKERQFVVVSAPGKRNDSDTKVTDALIKYYRTYIAGDDVSLQQKWIINRYADIVAELDLKPTILDRISKNIVSSTKTEFLLAMYILKKLDFLFPVSRVMPEFFHIAMIK